VTHKEKSVGKGPVKHERVIHTRGPAAHEEELKGDLPRLETLQGSRVSAVLPPDAIPAVDTPRFVSASDASAFMKDDEPVLGVVQDGAAKAYSLWHLDRHEIVNDRLGSQDVAVTW